MCVVMVSGLRVTEGLLLFGVESLLLCEGYTLSPAGDVCCRRHHPSRLVYVTQRHCEEHNVSYCSFMLDIHHPVCGLLFSSIRDAFISNMLMKELPSATCRRWLYEDIKEARFMRFLLEVRHPNSLSFSCNAIVGGMFF